jgi:hypothetical protein
MPNPSRAVTGRARSVPDVVEASPIGGNPRALIGRPTSTRAFSRLIDMPSGALPKADDLCCRRVPNVYPRGRTAPASGRRPRPLDLGEPRANAAGQVGQAYGSGGPRRAQSAPSGTASPAHTRSPPAHQRAPTCTCDRPGRPASAEPISQGGDTGSNPVGGATEKPSSEHF